MPTADESQRDPAQVDFLTRHARTGALLSGIAAAAMAGYLASTWQRPHRPALAVIGAALSLLCALVLALPLPQLAAGHRLERLLLGWAGLSSALITTAAVFDGGANSPIMWLNCLTMGYVAGVVPTRWAVAFCTAVVTAMVAVTIAGPPAAVGAALFTVALTGIVALLAVAQSQNLWLRYTTQHRQASHLAALADRDGLTGCLNHRAFHERLHTEVDRAHRSRQPLALLLADLDHFKDVNDHHGHPVGDRVLVQIAEVLRGAARSSDLVARLGGEEFVMLLPATDAAAAASVAERVRLAVAALTHPVPVTMSIGVSALPELASGALDLLERADVALYTAKRHGRNLAYLYDPKAPNTAASPSMGARDPAAGPQTGTGDSLRDGLLATADDASESSFVERVLQAAREHLNMEVAFISEFDGGARMTFRHLEGDALSFGLAEGASMELGEAICHRLHATGKPLVLGDVATDSRAGRLTATRSAGIGAYIGVPVRLASGHLYGAFCCLSHGTDPTLGPRDVRTLRLLAELVADHIESDATANHEHEQRRGRIQAILQRQSIFVLFQPIVDLRDGHITGVEALARFSGVPALAADAWFTEAAAVGLGVEFELAALRKALDQLADLPGDAYLSLNVSPQTLCAPALRELLSEVAAERIVLELTEHAAVSDYGGLAHALAALRTAGARLAVDDAGAGYASLAHIVRLGPEIIKLDLQLTRGIDRDPARRAMAGALRAFAAGTDATIVAEGVETEGELAVLRELGIRQGQGFWLGRPQPAPLRGGLVSP